MSTLGDSPDTEFKQLYTGSRCNSLPSELLNTIFQQCKRNDLKQCALTCRSWNAAARPVFFSIVVLSSTEKIDVLISLVIKDKVIGGFVKEVDTWDMECNLHLLYLFSKTFKNIETITFERKYDNSMYRSLYDLLSTGEFSSLKHITGPMNVDQSEIYVKCVDIMKHRMTKIDIVGVKAYESLQQSLHTFIKLKTINIAFHSSVPFSVLNVFEDITQKNNLPSLNEIEVIILNDSHFGSNELIPRMGDIQPMPNVSYLKISGYSSRTIIDYTFMCYVIKKFPNLQRLKLQSYRGGDGDFCFHLPKEDNQIVLSVDVAVKFLEYVSRLSTFNVQHIATEEKTAEIIENFYSNIRKKALDNPPSLHMYYNEQIEGDEELDLIYPVVSMKSTQASQNYAPSIISVGLHPISNSGEERKLMKYTGQYFTKITLDTMPTYSFRILLSNIAKYCVNLKELVILNTSELLEETIEWNDLVVNHSLTHLTVDPNDECPNLLSFLLYLFVGLETLTFSSTEKYANVSEKEFDLIIPRLSAKHFQIELPAYGYFCSTICDNFRFFVHLDVGGKSRYLSFLLLLKESEIFHRLFLLLFDKEVTASEFEECQKNDKNYCVFYHIQCKSAEKVSIKYPVEERTMLDGGDSFVYRIHEVHF